MIDKGVITKNDLEYRLVKANVSGYEWRQRRHEDWRENYTLYRDKVQINRLTQRQSVNVPLMKQMIKTLLSKVDDFVSLNFINLDNDKQKELFYNQYWTDFVVKDNRLELKDVVDKKQVMLYGRSFKKLRVENGKIKIDIVGPQDIVVDRFVDPTDLDTSRFVIQNHIFQTLSDLELNESYDKKALKELKKYFNSDMGLIKEAENAERLREKNEVMSDMGVEEVDNPQLGQTIVETSECFIKVWNKQTEAEEIVFGVMAEGNLLFADLQENVIGETKDNYWRNHFIFTSWGDDIDNKDFWNDGVGDTVRTPNKIVNSWFSQTVENRTLTNFGMNYYNSGAGGVDGEFIPQTFEPVPWGWYPIPGNPNEVIKRIDVPRLEGNLEEINFVVRMAEKASAATAITQGVSEEREITLGEVKILAGNAMDRIQSMSLFYQKDWLKVGEKYIKLLEAIGDDLEGVKLFKKGYRGNMFSKQIDSKSWQTESGYSVEVISQKDKTERDLEQVQKLQAVKAFFPDNQAMKLVFDKKMLDVANLTPDEVRQILDEEKQKQEQLLTQANQPPMLVGEEAINQPPELMGELNSLRDRATKLLPPPSPPMA